MKIKELNTILENLLEENAPYSPIADKYGGCELISYGKVGNFTTERVWMSGQVKGFLEDVSKNGGKGTITSVMRNGKNPEKDRLNPRHHNSGNKFDLKMDDISLTTVEDYDKQVIERVLPILNHPACKELSFECFGNNTVESTQIAKRIMNKIYTQYPNVKRPDLIVYTDWGWNYSNFRHVDVCISPEKL